MNNIDKKFLKQAVKQARISFEEGGFPAGSVLVKDGKMIAKSGSVSVNDPTGHSDTSCIRKACKKLKTTNLEGCTLYSSLEPCLMCFSAANWANVSRIVYGCQRSDELIGLFCYEGKTRIQDVNQENNHKIESEYISGFEDELIGMVEEWNEKIKNL